MKGRIYNEGAKRSLTTRLNTFAVLQEEDEIRTQAATRAERERVETERREKQMDKLKEETARLKSMRWADIEDDDDSEDEHQVGKDRANIFAQAAQLEDGANTLAGLDGRSANSPAQQEDQQPDSDEDDGVHTTLELKGCAPAPKKGKSKGVKNMDDLDKMLAAIKSNNAPNSESDNVVTNRPTNSAEAKKKAQELKARVAAATSRKAAPAPEEAEKKKLTKGQKKELKKQFER